MAIVLRLIVVFSMLYNAWIIFRVVNDWHGLLAAIGSIVLFPITGIIMPIVMFFIPSTVAGPLSLWPAIILIGLLNWVAGKLNISLLIR